MIRDRRFRPGGAPSPPGCFFVGLLCWPKFVLFLCVCFFARARLTCVRGCSYFSLEECVMAMQKESPVDSAPKASDDADSRLNAAVLRLEEAERELRLARKLERDARADAARSRR